MSYWLERSTAFLIISMSSIVVAADDDTIGKKLEKAKTAYKADVEKCRKAVADWFESVEQIARNRGDQKALKQYAEERKRFQDKGILPATITQTIAQNSTVARARMESAYTQAVKEYTRAKQDSEARSAESQLANLKLTAVGVTMTDWVRFRVPGRWQRRDGHEFLFHADGRLEEFGVAKLPITSGRWTIDKDGQGVVPLNNKWLFTFTLIGEDKMTAPARNPRGQKEGPWGLKKIE